MRYVYLLRNLVNNKVYIGQTKDPVRRCSAHFYIARKGNARPLYASIRKHGEANFAFEILEECADAAINEREEHWVAHFDSFNAEKGYNLTSGGRQHFQFSEETREKLRQKATGHRHSQATLEKIGEASRNRVRSEAEREKHSARLKGKPSFFKGKRHSEESLQKIREARALHRTASTNAANNT